MDALNAIGAWFDRQTWGVRHAVGWRWRRVRGLSGEFNSPEDTSRSRALTAAWERRWPGELPLSYLISSRPEYWVRFHSLPDSKRYAETEAEYREILGRQRTIMDELLAGSSLTDVIVVAADWPARDLASGASRRYLPEAWPWRIGTPDHDPEAGPVYFWAQIGLDEEKLDALLRAGADDQGRFLFTEPDMTWLLCPYDGGLDVFLTSATERDSLAHRHAAWLPAGGGAL